MQSAVVTVPFAILVLGLLSAGRAYLLALPVPTMVLAFVPAGMGGMVLTGKVLGLDAPVIAGFQMVRILVVILFCVPCYRLFDRTIARVAARG